MILIFGILLVDARASNNFPDQSWDSRDVRHSVSGGKSPSRISLQFRLTLDSFSPMFLTTLSSLALCHNFQSLVS